MTTNADGKISFRGPDDKIPYDSHPRLRVLFHGITPDTEEHKTLYTNMSPIGHVRADVPPLLICDGEKDPIVPGLHGKELYEKLKAVSADATYWMTPNGGHAFPGGAGLKKFWMTFLARTLKTDPIPSRQHFQPVNQPMNKHNLNQTRQANNRPGKFRKIFQFLNSSRLAVICSLALFSTTYGKEEGCLSCDLPVEITGEFAHHKNTEGPAIQGMIGDDESAFHEEIFGQDFSFVVAHLPAGKYTVVIGEAEIYFTAPDSESLTYPSGQNDCDQL
ncbi:MAG: prolyl oligopeptidase family serine peptidase [Limisphaerales bacterium]